MRVDTTANAVAILHGHLPADLPPKILPETLRRSAELDTEHQDGEQRAWIDNHILPEHTSVSTSEREAVYLSLATSATGLPDLSVGAGDPADPCEQWLWHLYRATRSRPEQGALADLLKKEYHFTGGVRSVFGLRGLATVGTWKDIIKQGYTESYYAGSAYHNRTLYSDAFSLAKLQDIVLEAFQSELAQLAKSKPHKKRIFQLERNLLIFQTTYWSCGFGKNEDVEAILRRWQAEAELTQKIQILKDDLTELSRQVQTFETETTNAILGLIATVGLPLATGLAIWAGLPDAGVKSLWQTLVPVGAVIITLIAVVPALRRLTLNAFKRRHRGE